MLSQAYSVIIDRGICAPGYGWEVVYGLNAIHKKFLFQSMSTVNTGTFTSDVSLAKKCQITMSNAAHKHVVIDKGKYKKVK